MKKLSFLILFLFLFSVPVSASERDTAQLMVTSCTVSEKGLSAGGKATVYITLKNQSETADAKYCKLTFAEASGDITPVGTGTQYVSVIEANDEYVWELPVQVAANASDGAHTASVHVSFTNPDGSDGSAEDTIRLSVSNKSAMEVGSVGVPGEVVSGDMADFSFSVLNTGKSKLYGVTMTVSVDGPGTVGKDSLGDIPAGGSATGNVRFSTEDYIISARAGTVTFTGETADGKTVSVSERFYFDIVENESDSTAQEKEDRSQPRLMVSSFTVQEDALFPGERRKVSVTIVNTHKDKDVYNLKLSFAPQSDAIASEGMGTMYLDKLEAGDFYVWELYVNTAHTAKSGLHNATVSVEYEDENGGAYSNSDTLRLPVRQTVLLVWDNLNFPANSVIGETVSLSFSLQNMGGAAVSNVLVTFEAEGLRGAGSVLVGTIEAGQTATVNANFNVTAENEGELKGIATVRFQDDFGDNHAEDIEIVTKAIKKAPVPTEEEEKKQAQAENGMRLWWVFLIAGLAVGGGAVGGTLWFIRDKKQRKEDESRL
ncbi:MAG: hypothetical protein IKB13_09510 [Clostridia bacterium]|nr:hypothetical protein [Clostridia bacterium]